MIKVDKIEYYEKVGWGIFMKTLLIVLTLVFGIIGLAGWYSVSLLSGFVMALPVLLIISIVYINFGSLKISITSKELVVVFGFFNHKRFFLCEIESCEQTTTNFKKDFGVGIRTCPQ